MKMHDAAHSAPLLQSSLLPPVSSSGGEVRCASAVIVGAGFGSKSSDSDLLQGRELGPIRASPPPTRRQQGCWRGLRHLYTAGAKRVVRYYRR